MCNDNERKATDTVAATVAGGSTRMTGDGPNAFTTLAEDGAAATLSSRLLVHRATEEPSRSPESPMNAPTSSPSNLHESSIAPQRDRPVSCPGAVFEPGQPYRESVASTLRPTLPQRWQRLDDAIQTKVQRHCQTAADSLPSDSQVIRASSEAIPPAMSRQYSSGSETSSMASSLRKKEQPRDRPASRPGAVFEPAKRTGDKVDSTQQPTLSQRLESIDYAIQGKRQCHSGTATNPTPLTSFHASGTVQNSTVSFSIPAPDTKAMKLGRVGATAERFDSRSDSENKQHDGVIDYPEILRAPSSEAIRKAVARQYSSGSEISSVASRRRSYLPRPVRNEVVPDSMELRIATKLAKCKNPISFDHHRSASPTSGQTNVTQLAVREINSVGHKPRRSRRSTAAESLQARLTGLDPKESDDDLGSVYSSDCSMENLTSDNYDRRKPLFARSYSSGSDTSTCSRLLVRPAVGMPAALNHLEYRMANKLVQNQDIQSHDDRRSPRMIAVEGRGASKSLSSADTMGSTAHSRVDNGIDVANGSRGRSIDRDMAAHDALRNIEEAVRAKLTSNAESEAYQVLQNTEASIRAKLNGIPDSAVANLDSRIECKIRSRSTSPTSKVAPRVNPGSCIPVNNQDSEGEVIVTSKKMRRHLAGTSVSRVSNRSGDSVADMDDMNSESESCGRSRVVYTEKYTDLFRDAFHEDVECGVLEPDPANLAVAVVVEDDDEQFLPSAVEYDPDAKPPMLRNRRFRLFACLAMEVILVGLIGAIVGVVLSNHEHIYAPPLPDRDTLGIREFLATMVGPADFDDLLSPYRKALDWIQYDDPISLTPESPKLSQRFLAAYLYFGTSEQTPWNNGCDARSDDSTNDCTFKTNNIEDPTKVAKTSAKRWLSSEDECLWGGVTCDPLGQIQWLDFSGSNMTGSFPEGIQSLPFLRRLCLAHGALRGTLPASIGEGMKHLESLELAGNVFSGTIPDSWYRSRILRRLNMAANALTGTLSKDIGKWKDMKYLHIFDNAGIVGTLPDEIGNLTNIWWLKANGNGLVGTIPTSMGHLRWCERLSLADNKLTHSIPTELGLMSSLNHLFLENNQLTGSIPEQFSRLNFLDTLHLNDNMLTGSLAPFSNMTAMAVLRLERNRFTGTLSPGFDQFVELVEFAVSGNHLTGTVSQGLCNLVQPLDKPGTRKQLSFLELDCTVPSQHGTAEISCPCCTDCCDPDGENCQPMND